jgi:hypothetical protein
MQIADSLARNLERLGLRRQANELDLPGRLIGGESKRISI